MVYTNICQHCKDYSYDLMMFSGEFGGRDITLRNRSNWIYLPLQRDTHKVHQAKLPNCRGRQGNINHKKCILKYIIFKKIYLTLSALIDYNRLNCVFFWRGKSPLLGIR